MSETNSTGTTVSTAGALPWMIGFPIMSSWSMLTYTLNVRNVHFHGGCDLWAGRCGWESWNSHSEFIYVIMVVIQFWGNYSRRLCVDSSLLNLKFVGGDLNHKVAIQLSWQSYDHCNVLHFCWVKLNRTYCGDSLSCLNFYRWDVLFCTDWNRQFLDF